MNCRRVARDNADARCRHRAVHCARATARNAPARERFSARSSRNENCQPSRLREIAQRSPIAARVQHIGRQCREPAREMIAAIDRQSERGVDAAAFAERA